MKIENSSMPDEIKQLTAIETLIAHMEHELVKVCMSFEEFRGEKRWRLVEDVPNTAGWYYFETDTPLDVLQKQVRSASFYTTKREKKKASVQNIDIARQAKRFRRELEPYWNTKQVYSGMASKLKSRVRDHIGWTNEGTGALALSRYPALGEFEWNFYYVTTEKFVEGTVFDKMLLNLGEQAWRAKNGWPILCSR